MNPIVAQVLQSGKATLRELREVYSLEDMYNIWEVHYTGIYNRWLEVERDRKARERRIGR